MSRYVKGQVGLHDDLGNAVDTLIPRKCHASNRLITPGDYASVQIPVCSVDENGVMVPGEHKIIVISGVLRSQAESDHAINHILIGSGVLRGRSSRQPKWLKKRQAEARKKFAAKKVTRRGPGGKKPFGKRPAGKGTGARPQGKGPRPEGKGARPEGKGPRPEGRRPEGKGPRPEGKGARPEGKRPEGKRPEGKRPEGKRPEGKRPEGKRPEGKRPTASQAAAAAAN